MITLDPDSRETQTREPVRFLVFSASLRAESLNERLARLAAATIEANGGTVDLASMREFDTPSYDADVQASDGFPSGAESFRERVQTNDALVISCPEYNFSMPGALKNSIDWYRASAHSHLTRSTDCSCRHLRRWPVATEVCGPCAFRSSTWARESIPTCSHWLRHTMPSTQTDGSPTHSCKSASRAASSASWTSSRPPSTTRASRPGGSSSSAAVGHRIASMISGTPSWRVCMLAR
jgi:NADPH-dependent FMN reductase